MPLSDRGDPYPPISPTKMPGSTTSRAARVVRTRRPGPEAGVGPATAGPSDSAPACAIGGKKPGDAATSSTQTRCPSSPPTRARGRRAGTRARRRNPRSKPTSSSPKRSTTQSSGFDSWNGCVPSTPQPAPKASQKPPSHVVVAHRTQERRANPRTVSSFPTPTQGTKNAPELRELPSPCRGGWFAPCGRGRRVDRSAAPETQELCRASRPGAAGAPRASGASPSLPA